jgi:hypothetical protein
MIGLITALGILFAMARHYLVPWQSDQSAASALSKVNAQIFMEPRGQYFFRQFAGEKLSQRAIYVHLPDPRVNDETLKIVSRLPYTELLTIGTLQSQSQRDALELAKKTSLGVW